MFSGMLPIDVKSNKNYECLQLSTKKQGVMYNRQKKCQLTGREKKKQSLMKSEESG